MGVYKAIPFINSLYTTKKNPLPEYVNITDLKSHQGSLVFVDMMACFYEKLLYIDNPKKFKLFIQFCKDHLSRYQILVFDGCRSLEKYEASMKRSSKDHTKVNDYFE